MDVRDMLNEKGKPLIVVNNYKFNLHHKSKKTDLETWRCVLRNCSVRLKRRNIVIEVDKSDFNHNHDFDPYLSRQIVTIN